VAIVPNVPLAGNGGVVVSYSIFPPLPSGLSLDTVSGVISGTARVESASTAYTVLARNGGGSVPAFLTIQVIGLNPCLSSPCQNGAVCMPQNVSFVCQCAAGFDGILCANGMDECASNPCQNGGSCVDGADSFICQCAAGFSGGICQIDFDECSVHPCLHGGQCSQGMGSYVCTCPAGMLGTNCQTDSTVTAVAQDSVRVSLTLGVPMSVATGDSSFSGSLLLDISRALNVSSSRFRFVSYTNGSRGLVVTFDIVVDAHDSRAQTSPAQLYGRLIEQIADSGSTLRNSSAHALAITNIAQQCADGTVSSNCPSAATSSSGCSDGYLAGIIVLLIIVVLLCCYIVYKSCRSEEKSPKKAKAGLESNKHATAAAFSGAGAASGASGASGASSAPVAPVVPVVATV